MAQTKETIEKIQLRRAIQAIEQMKAELVQIKYQQHEPIAIIGMGCRYPGGPAGDIETPEEYWIRLLEGFDGIVEMSEKRRRDIYGPHKQPNRYALHGGYLAHIDQFDPLFFGISPREALVMDPVHRLLLETTWHALEDANIVPKTWLNHEVGVFIGTAGSSGHEMLCVNQKNLYAAIGHASSTASGRISYLLGLTGPCVSIDTACSSSLVAVHQACQSLRNGECKAALAGGVGVLVEDAITEIFGNSHMLADDAHCKTFDADAGGYVRSEGCGIVVLKRLSDSQRDDDNIIAVIRGTSINQDGPSGGIAVPNGPSQRRVIQRALDDARLTPTQIGYVEAHGIGSPIGDSIEMGALDAVFKDREHPLYVGSVKTNLGHLECAAGIAGFMKLALAVQDGQIPPHLHFHTPSPYINWDASSVQITTAATPWTRTEKDTLRIGGVSAFGYSGSNAHVIVSESPDATTASPAAATIVEEWSFHLLTISAKHEDVLSTIAQKYADYLQAHPDINLGDLCYTSHVGRSHFDHRLALTASSAEEMQRLLTAYTNRDGEDTLPANISQKPGGSQTPPHIAFLFTDVSVPPSRRLSMSKPNAPLRHAQGAERLLTDQETLYVVMGQELYETAPTFRDVIDRCDAIFQEVGGCSLVDLLYLESGIGILARNEKLGQSPETDKDVHAIIGAAIFAMQCALIELWRSWGITPDVVLGHGVGDFAAAYAAGVMSLEDGVRLVTKRDQLMETLTTNCSPLPDPILDEFEQAVQSATLNPPNLTVISSTTGKIISDELSHPPYWRKQLRKPIGMDDALTTPHKQNIDLLIKIGPNSEELIVNSEELIVNSGELIVNSGELIVNSISPSHPRWLSLSKPTRPLRQAQGAEQLHSISPSHPHTITPPHHHTPTPPHPPSDWQQILNTLSALYVHGVDIDWECVDQHYPRKKITLPTYPFRRQRYWIRDQDEALSGTASQNQFAQWLAAQSMAELADTVVEKGQFAAEERDAIIKAFTLLEEERLAQERMQDMQSLLYEVAWEPQQMPTVSEPQPDDINGHWLILADRGGIGERIASQLRERGATVDLIRTEQELATCLARCVNGTDGSLLLHGIVHLWGLDDEAAEDTISLMAGQKRTLNSVLQIVQACAEATLVPTYRLWIVTQGAEAVLPKEPVAFAQTTLWGVGRIIALEHGDLWGGLVDIDGDATIVNRAETVFAELLNAQPDDETQIAYRHGKRHVARFTPLQSLPKQRTPKIKIQADATYLITGGLGALGLHTTQWMATQGARHLILTGRSGIRTAEQRAIVNELDAQGITIQIAQVDVADATSMHDLFEGIRANTTNPLRGIIHIAGLSGRDAIRSLNWARFEQVLRPKVSGGWLLHHLSLEMDLDFFISYASVAGILGDRQNTHYSAANHFLDGLMTHRQSLGLPGLSIAWGPWAGGGMISADAEMRLAEIGVSSMSPEIGIDLQAYLLQTTIPQVTTIDIEHGRLNRLYELTKSRAFLSRLAQAVPETTATSSSGIPSMIVELESMPTHRRLAYIESYLQQVIAGLLVIPDMPNRNTRFTEMGLDSLMALEFRRQLESDLGQTLPITAAFDYPTVASMAAHLLDEVLGPTEQTSELT